MWVFLWSAWVVLGLSARLGPPPTTHAPVQHTTTTVHTTTTAKQKTGGDSEEDYSDEIDWQCGTDFFSKMMSEGQIEVDCPKLKVPINNCCLAHDDCYDKQLGRKHCDDVFCNCLASATVSSRICHKEDGPLFCTLVRELGDDAYSAAGNTTSSPVTPITHTTAAPAQNTTRATSQHQAPVTKPTTPAPSSLLGRMANSHHQEHHVYSRARLRGVLTAPSWTGAIPLPESPLDMNAQLPLKRVSANTGRRTQAPGLRRTSFSHLTIR